MTTSLENPTAGTTMRRTDGLVGNGLVLAGVVLFLCEFVGIIGAHVHTMPLLPGASAHALASAYAGQTGVTGFLVGWYSLVLPGRVLFVLGMRQALLASAPSRLGDTWRALLTWATATMAVGVALELTSAAVLAGTSLAAEQRDADLVAALDRVAHYLQVALSCPSAVAAVVVGAAMWRSGVFPRVLAGLVVVVPAVQLVAGALLSAPSTASLQDGLTVLNLLSIPVLIWLGVLVLRHRPRRAAGEVRA